MIASSEEGVRVKAMGRKRMHKRANGEGSVYLRADGRWAAELTTGYDEAGRQVRPRVYGKTQAEVRAKLDEVKRRVSQGLQAKPERLTVAEFLERWRTLRGCQPHVSFKTEETYRDQINLHIVPLVEGMPPARRGSRSVAASRARAKALNNASAW